MEVTPEAVTLSVLELRALMAHASKDETRGNLNGVAIDAAHSRCFSTDGHRALVAQALADRVGPAVEPIVVPLRHLDVARRAVAADGSIRIRRYAVAASGAGGAPALAAGPDHVGIEVLDRFGGLVTAIHVDCGPAGRPPPIAEVLPPLSATEGPRVPVAGMATEYLAALVTVTRATGAAGIEIWPPVGQLDPWGFSARSKDGSAHWTCVIMPMRLETDAKPAPRTASETAASAPAPVLPAPAAKGRKGRKAA